MSGSHTLDFNERLDELYISSDSRFLTGVCPDEKERAEHAENRRKPAPTAEGDVRWGYLRNMIHIFLFLNDSRLHLFFSTENVSNSSFESR